MTCGTEEVSDKEIASCSACGSDSLARFDIPDIDIVEKIPKRKPSVQKKPKIEIERESVDDLLRKITTRPPFPSYHTVASSGGLSSAGGTAVLPSAKIFPPEKKINWKKIARIVVPLAIGAATFGLIMLFI